MTQKIFVAQLGIGKGEKGYIEQEYDFNGTMIKAHIPFSILLNEEQYDAIFIVGTEQSFDPERESYKQYVQEVKSKFDENRIQEISIDKADTPEKFWENFENIYQEISHKVKGKKTIIHADITFGFRNQSLLLFLVLYFLQEMLDNVKVERIYYNSEKSEKPKDKEKSHDNEKPHDSEKSHNNETTIDNQESHDSEKPAQIIDFSEIFELIEWINALRNFEEFRSLKLLVKKLEPLVDKSNELQTEFLNELINLNNSYAFNYVKDIEQHSRWTYELWSQKDVKNLVNKSKPFKLTSFKFKEFFKYFTKFKDISDVAPHLIQHYMEVGDYSKALILLREHMLNIFQQLLLLQETRENRRLVEDKLMNLIGCVVVPKEYSGFRISSQDRELANRIVDVLQNALGKTLEPFFKDWVEVRKYRNRSAHIQNINKDEIITDFRKLISDINSIFERTEGEYREWIGLVKNNPDYENAINTIIGEIKSEEKIDDKRLFLIVNEGLHPIQPILKKQFGENIKTEIITHGNVGLEDEKEVARKTIEVVEKYPDHEFYIVPSGYQYLGLTVYNVVQQKTSKHPVWLHYDRDGQKYIPKILDPRKLIFE